MCWGKRSNRHALVRCSSPPLNSSVRRPLRHMAKTAINYLFPPDKINELRSWRFVLHFKLSSEVIDKSVQEALRRLRSAEWKIIDFPFGLENLPYDEKSGTVATN